MSKDNFIRLRVAGWEKDYIQRKAQSANLSLSEFVRRAAMHQRSMCSAAPMKKCCRSSDARATT